ncbi:Alt-like RNA polymerase ADP-ribosyltransferase [Enterobacter phage CC31]|uniref:NAD(+)--arginine ADP-ribosyltransferase n=2 Tax=root TaxID=1 RepID=E5DHT1_9CAUD|nr:Alt-like RNA polymerase ADP-ribosyltransferase [Enterobacter phage CC31]ADB81695.1 RNA polymerase ADP-ribosylase [Enterobacter phage CC31]
MTEFQLNEIFDADSEMLPVTNLYPKTKIPQIFAIAAPEGSVALRMCSYTGGGDVNKNVKPGDKMMHAIVLGVSEKGTLVKLKNLGGNPLGVISTMFDLVSQTVKKYKMDAVMFRINKSKMGGQARAVQMIINRLVMSRLGGRFVILKELYDYDKKYVYVLIHRKNVDLSTIPGIPEISTEEFTKVDTAVGDVYINNKSGKQVSKSEALAATIAQENDKRTDQSVIARAKVSRRQVAASQSLTSDIIHDPEEFEKYEATAAEFSKPATANPIPEAQQLKDAVESKAAKARSAQLAATGAIFHLKSLTTIKLSQSEKFEQRFVKELESRIGNAPLTSVQSMQAYTQTLLDTLEERKYEAMEHIMTKVPQYLEPKDKEQMANNLWNIERTKMIKAALQGYAKNVSATIEDITRTRTPLQYTNAEKRGIKEYVGSGYSDINNMLLGRYRADNYDTLSYKEVTTAIKNLDDAFKRGDRIPEGLTLWRSQSVRKPIFEAMVKNRVFYFRNYVSTSLSPIIFGGWKGNQAVAMASDNTRAVLNQPDNSAETVKLASMTYAELGLTDEVHAAKDVQQAESTRVMIGWAITGGEKVNVVYPGDLSNMSGEMEVILPRGTMLKVNSIVDASYSDGLVYDNQKFIQGEVMTADQLDEAVVYDGDVLMETGEVVEYSDEPQPEPSPYDFEGFVKSTKASESNKILALLASMIDVEDTPEKFVL